MDFYFWPLFKACNYFDIWYNPLLFDVNVMPQMQVRIHVVCVYLAHSLYTRTRTNTNTNTCTNSLVLNKWSFNLLKHSNAEILHLLPPQHASAQRAVPRLPHDQFVPALYIVIYTCLSATPKTKVLPKTKIIPKAKGLTMSRVWRRKNCVRSNGEGVGNCVSETSLF